MASKKCLIHKWSGCTCTKCGATRHQWGEDCKCNRCGKEHDWKWDGVSCYEKCVRCGAQRNDRDHHKWNEVEKRGSKGCKCTVCGAVNHDYFRGHKYVDIENSCDRVCSVCGKVQKDATHNWDHCTCRKCGKVRENNHDWNHCTCRVCGETRDSIIEKNHHVNVHDWNHCTCSVCGKTRDKDHDWVTQGCVRVCSVCGKEERNYSDEAHDWEMLPNCKRKCRKCGYVKDINDEAHDWEILADCKKKCKKCGSVRANHTYKTETKWFTTVEYEDGNRNDISWSEDQSTCIVCGHKPSLLDNR